MDTLTWIIVALVLCCFLLALLLHRAAKRYEIDRTDANRDRVRTLVRLTFMLSIPTLVVSVASLPRDPREDMALAMELVHLAPTPDSEAVDSEGDA